MSEQISKKEAKALIKWNYWNSRVNKMEAKGIFKGERYKRARWNLMAMDKVMDSIFLDQGNRVSVIALNEKSPFSAQERANFNNFQKRLAKKAKRIQDYL